MAPYDSCLTPTGGGLLEPQGTAGFRPITDLETPLGAAAPDHPALRALFGALMSAGPDAAEAGWRADEGRAHITQRIGLEPVRIQLHAESAEAAWRDVRAVTPLALDVLTVLIERFGSEGGEVRLVRSAEVLNAKGCRRWGGERQALEEQIGRELMLLGRITVGAGGHPIFSVTPVGEAPTSFVVSLDPAMRDAWMAAPTRWLRLGVLSFDHRTNRGADVLAKKLGLYFGLAGAGEAGRPVVRSVRALLKAAGVLHEVASGARGGRLADRFDEALLRLEENGLFAASYRGEHRELQARMKGWVKRWLETELRIEACP